MPLDMNFLSPITHQGKRGSAITIWSYQTLDATATVDTAGYFNGAADLLRVGDIIERISWTTAIGAGGTISTYGRHIVNSNTGGVVDVADTTAGTVTDTD